MRKNRSFFANVRIDIPCMIFHLHHPLIFFIEIPADLLKIVRKSIFMDSYTLQDPGPLPARQMVETFNFLDINIMSH